MQFLCWPTDTLPATGVHVSSGEVGYFSTCSFIWGVMITVSSSGTVGYGAVARGVLILQDVQVVRHLLVVHVARIWSPDFSLMFLVQLLQQEPDFIQNVLSLPVERRRLEGAADPAFSLTLCTSFGEAHTDILVKLETLFRQHENEGELN